MDCVELSLKGVLGIRLGCKVRLYNELSSSALVPGYAMLMGPNKAETAVHGCHSSGDMAERMCRVLAIPRSCVM